MLEKGKEEDAEKKGDLVGGCVGGVDVAGRLCAGGSEGGVVNIDCVLDVGVDQDCDDRHAEELGPLQLGMGLSIEENVSPGRQAMQRQI